MRAEPVGGDKMDKWSCAMLFRRRPESMRWVIRDLDVCGGPRTWIPACAGMTRWWGGLWEEVRIPPPNLPLKRGRNLAGGGARCCDKRDRLLPLSGGGWEGVLRCWAYLRPG